MSFDTLPVYRGLRVPRVARVIRSDETLSPRRAEDLVPPVPENPGPAADIARERRAVVIYLVVLVVLGGSLAFGILR